MTFKIAWASVVYLGQLRQVLTKRPRTAHGIPVQLCFVAPVYRINVRTTRIEVTLEINCVNDLDRWSKEGDTYIMILIIILLMRWFAMFESFKRLKHIFPNKSNKVHSPFPFTRPWGGRLGDPGKGQRQLSPGYFGLDPRKLTSCRGRCRVSAFWNIGISTNGGTP